LSGVSPEYPIHGPYGEVAGVDLGEVIGFDLVKESFSCHVAGKKSVRYEGRVRRVLRI
jgi:hypothetical protein